jgi:hypothetical protein
MAKRALPLFGGRHDDLAAASDRSAANGRAGCSGVHGRPTGGNEVSLMRQRLADVMGTVSRTAMGRALGIAAVTLLLMSGCDAGRDAETSREVPAIPGADAQAGPIALRDLLIPFREGGYPAGSDVPLVVRLFSSANQAVEVSRVTPGPGGAMADQPQEIVLRQSAAAGSGRPVTSLAIPPQGFLLLVPGSGPYLLAEHIATALPYGESMPVRFTFSTGDSVEVDMPMAPPASPVTGQTPSTGPSGGTQGSNDG